MNDWTAVTVETSTEAVDAVSYILTDTGAAGIQIEDAADFAKLKPGRYGDEIIDPTAKREPRLRDIIPAMFLFQSFCLASSSGF